MSTKKDLRETLLDGLEQLIRDGSNKQFWFSTRATADAVIALNFCLPSTEFTKLKNSGLQSLLAESEEIDDTLNWNEEIWDSAIAAIALAVEPVRYSVGGAEVAARMHAVFSGLGCWSPPCSTLVLSRIGQEAVAASQGQADDPNEDVWRVDDLDVVLTNLIIATSLKSDSWISWPSIELKIPDGPWPENGTLNLDTPKFL